MARFNFDPNQIISLIQGQQAGNPFPSSVPGLPNQGMGRFQNFMDRASPDQLSGTLGAFQQFAPTWQQGEDWKMKDVFGMGPGRFFRKGYQDFMPQNAATPSVNTGGTGVPGAGMGGAWGGNSAGAGMGNNNGMRPSGGK